MRHFLLAAVYAACIATFFGNMLRDDVKSGIRLGVALFAIMVLSVFALGWLMLLLSP